MEDGRHAAVAGEEGEHGVAWVGAPCSCWAVGRIGRHDAAWVVDSSEEVSGDSSSAALRPQPGSCYCYYSSPPWDEPSHPKFPWREFALPGASRLLVREQPEQHS